MDKPLAQRWLEAVRPFQLGSLKDSFEPYIKNVTADEETKRRLRRVVDGFTEEEATDILMPFIEEHLSEDTLAAAVAFFESPAGQKYLEQRKRVDATFMDKVGRALAERINRAFPG